MSNLRDLEQKKQDLRNLLADSSMSDMHSSVEAKLAKINAQISKIRGSKTVSGSNRYVGNSKSAKGATMSIRKAKTAATAKKSAGATAPKKTLRTANYSDNRSRVKRGKQTKQEFDTVRFENGNNPYSKRKAKKATEKPAKKAAEKPQKDKTPKAKKTVKEKPQKSEFAGNYVENIDTEKKILGRVLALHGKNTTKVELEKILRAFNTAKTNRTIRKDSVHAGILEKVYNFILVTNSELRKPDAKTPKIVFKPETLAALQNVVNQDAVFPSILVLRKYINYQGKKPTKTVLDKWFKDATKITTKDKYYAKVQEAMRVIRIYEAGKSQTVFIPKTALNGLAGLLGK